MVMSIENPFASNNQNQEDAFEKSPDILPITSLEEYLDLLKANPIETTNREDRKKEKEENKNKITGERTNEINTHVADEMMKRGFFEEIGYYSNENPFTIEQYQSYLEEGFAVIDLGVYDDQNEMIGNHYYREKAGLTEHESAIKSGIIKAYDTLTEERWFYVKQVINSQFEEKVRAGEMAYLGEKTMGEYMGMIEQGLSSVHVELSPVVDIFKNLSADLNHKIYARIK